MTESIIFAGFGGQGVLLAGKILCIAAMRQGLKVSHIPAYGAEMRGGTANCTVVISDEDISSPVVPRPASCIVLNKPSLLKFEERVREGGLLIWNSSLIDLKPSRTDIQVVEVRANDLAEEAGSVRTANMVVLGLLVALKPELANLDALIEALDEAVSSRNRALNAVNAASLQKGYALA
jgi:2-oxoglutarate ferredoxin oxidoreductase subunit gamma